MSVRAIRQVGDPILRTPADRVRNFDHRLRELIADLEDTVDAPGHAGLAAPQIGVGLRVFSYNIDGKIGHLVNPRLVERSEKRETEDEGCLSVPGSGFPPYERCPRFYLDRLIGQTKRAAHRALA